MRIGILNVTEPNRYQGHIVSVSFACLFFCIFTALHGMQTGVAMRKLSVCPSNA